MNFKEFLAKLGSAANKTLADAKALLTEAATVLDAAVAEIEAKATALSTAEASLVTVRAELATANANLVTANAQVTELTEQVASIEAGVITVLGSAGIKVAKLDADSVKAAAKANAESRAHEFLAARGIKPLPEKVNNPGEQEVEPKTDAQIAAAYTALPAGSAESIAFLEKHKDAIWRVHTGR